MRHSTSYDIPVLSPHLAMVQPVDLWQVSMRVQRLDLAHTWRGYAADEDQARARALEDARHRWAGFSVAILCVVAL